MKYTIKVLKQVLVLQLSGDIIGEENGPELIGAINDKLADGHTLCVVDLSGIRYINSSGLGLIITIHTKFKNKGGEMVIVNPSDHVKKLFSITKLDNIFKIFGSLEESIKELKK